MNKERLLNRSVHRVLWFALPAILLFASSAQGMYDPHHGRWFQRDPLGYADGMNLYEYVGNMPCNFVDPEGLTFVDGGNTGNDILWWFGGAGGRGNEGMGSIQIDKPPRIRKVGCCCTVEPRTGVATVKRSYSGVKAGDQGVSKGTFFVGSRGYVTTVLASHINAHEAGHVRASAVVHDRTIAVAETRATLFQHMKLCCPKDDCRKVLEQMINWSFWTSEFSRLDVIANSDASGSMHQWETAQGGGPTANPTLGAIGGTWYDVILRSRAETEPSYRLPDYSKYDPPQPGKEPTVSHGCKPCLTSKCPC